MVEARIATRTCPGPGSGLATRRRSTLRAPGRYAASIVSSDMAHSLSVVTVIESAVASPGRHTLLVAILIAHLQIAELLIQLQPHREMSRIVPEVHQLVRIPAHIVELS